MPRWRPSFVAALEPTDRCHRNGLARVIGRPHYVTAVGETDAPMGRRANKAGVGIVMDVASGEVVARGLSMPHSPRWYASRLWGCESGAGTFGSIDVKTGKYEPITEVPGFTCGVEARTPSAARTREERSVFASVDVRVLPRILSQAPRRSRQFFGVQIRVIGKRECIACGVLPRRVDARSRSPR